MKNSTNLYFTGRATIKQAVLLLLVLLTHDLYSQPTITSFAPTSAAMGTTVVITGTNFTGTNAVSFNGIPASSFTVNSDTKISAVVPLTTSGSVRVTTAGGTALKALFHYLALSGIITDFAGYWSTTTELNNPLLPDNSHNLLAFSYNGITFSTGVNNGLLTGQGINYTPGHFRSLPVANISGTNSSSSIYLAMATKADGAATLASVNGFAGVTVRNAMTDGINGLNMGTGVTNLPTSANMTFKVHQIFPAKIVDAEPDLIITQIADPTTANDTFQFVNAAGVTLGNYITQNMNLLTKLGSYSLDLFNLSPDASFNSAVCYSAYSANGSREMRLVGFKLSDFGITAANYTQVESLKITPSGTSDYAFIAYSDAMEMAPNISRNDEKTNISVCAGGTAHLEVITAPAYGGLLTYVWEESINGGSTWSVVTDGGNYTGALSNRLTIALATNNYKYRSTVTESGTGFSASSSIFNVLVSAPAAPTSVTGWTKTTTCLNSLVSLTRSITGGSNLFYQWETNVSGSYVVIPGATAKTYLPPVNTLGVTSYRLTVSSGSGCSAVTSSTFDTVTVVGISSITTAARCGPGVVSLGASASSGTINWYTTATGSVVGTGTVYSPSITATTIFYVSTNATQCGTGSRIPVLATVNPVTWAGTNSIDWNTLSNWNCGGIPPLALPTSTTNVIIPTFPTGGRFPTTATAAFVNNITIEPGASLTVATGGVFEINGAISNSGTFTSTQGTISMKGSAQQTIPAGAFSTHTIKNLTINNAAGVLIGGELNVTGTYTPTAGLLTTFGHLTLKSDSLGTARVAPATGTYVSGNVNVERFIPERRSWRLMTSPISNSNTIYESWQNGGVFEAGIGLLVTAPGGGTGIDAPGNSSMKKWNVATQSLQVVNNTHLPLSATNTGATDNTGYLIFVRGDRSMSNIDPGIVRKNNTTLTSTGYLQTGTQTFTGLSTVAGGFSLLGNPYASPIDMKLVFNNISGTTNIKRKFYVWDPRINAQTGGYVVLDDVNNPGVFAPTPASSSQNNYIQSSQAFFVITNAAGAASVQVKETDKAAINNTAIFGKPVEVPQTQSMIVNLLLFDQTDSSTIVADGTRADFDNRFSAGIDDDDNIKFGNINETFGLTRNNVFLATERRPAIGKRDTLFLKLTKTTKRSYQLQIQPIKFDGIPVVANLDDSYTGVSVPLGLTGTTTVNFVTNANPLSQVADRFRIVFREAGPLPVSFTSVKAYKQNSKVKVEWKVENELNIVSYDVDKSVDGIAFRKISTISAGGNNLNSAVYTLLDKDVNSGENFYRIRSLGVNGKMEYSQVVKVTMDLPGAGISVYPNPVTGKIIKLQFTGQLPGPYTIEITNAAGQTMMIKTLDHAGGSEIKNIPLPSAINTGHYQLQVAGKGLEKTIKIFVQ